MRNSSWPQLQEILKTEIPSNVVVAVLVAWAGNWIGIPTLPLAIIILSFLLSKNSLGLEKANLSELIEVKEIKEEREKIIERIERSDSVVDIIRLNLNQITEYYTINKNQARRSFSFSASVILLGFITIVAAIVITFMREGQQLEISIISGISGILLQFIGGANFVLYNRTVEQSNRFYKQLIRIQDTMLAVELCKQIKDQDKNLELMDKIITNLINRSSIELEFGLVEGSHFKSAKRQSSRLENETESGSSS